MYSFAANNSPPQMSYDDLTVTRRLRREEQAEERYAELFDQVKAEQEAEWAAEFDAIPFKPNGAEIHRIVMRLMNQLMEGA